jgi:hypothetical protein
MNNAVCNANRVAVLWAVLAPFIPVQNIHAQQAAGRTAGPIASSSANAPAAGLKGHDGKSSPWRIGVYRTKIPGGWLVQIFEKGVAFVNDPEHQWDGNSLV